MGPDDHDGEGFPGLGRRIMIAAIFSLFIVVMLLILLHFYARYLAKRQERRRLAFLNSLASQVLPIDPAITFPVYPEPPPQAAPGLNSSVIASLPTFEYAPEKGLDGGGGEQMECSVCLSLVAGGARVRLLPNCKHLFHADCIDKWLSSHTTCPICRTGAEPERVQHEVKAADTRVQPSAPPMGGDAQDLERQ